MIDSADGVRTERGGRSVVGTAIGSSDLVDAL
jgi:hypothetical protein